MCVELVAVFKFFLCEDVLDHIAPLKRFLLTLWFLINFVHSFIVFLSDVLLLKVYTLVFHIYSLFRSRGVFCFLVFILGVNRIERVLSSQSMVFSCLLFLEYAEP